MLSPVFLLLIATLHTCNCANILGVALHPSFSHQVVFRPIWKHLSLRGHNVTVLTTDPTKDITLTNLTEIDLSLAYDIWRSSNIMEVSRKEGFLSFFWKSIEVGERIMRAEMNLKEVKDLLEDNERAFDLVIVEPVYTLGLGFAERFKCPIVLVLSTDATGTVHNYYGNPIHPILYPLMFLSFGNPMTFTERLASFLFYFVENIMKNLLFERNNRLLKEYFGESASIEDIFARASLLLTNISPIFGILRPTVPAVIPIGGGFHLEDPKPLPHDLKTILDNSTRGVVYFSLGSNVLSTKLERDKRQILKKVFKELPFQVIWKYEEEAMDGKPDNVHLVKWVPQCDLLRHPNVKVFITQGGLQSLEEALYANVPVVGMPQVADQFFNMKTVVHKGIGVTVDLKNLRKDELKEAILEVAQNPRYKERMKQLVDFSNDQPIANLDKAIWWIEYVLRHNGTTNLKASDAGIPLYKYYNFDVIVTLLTIATVGVFSSIKMYLYLVSSTRITNAKNK